jgi:hypothetical protein
MSRETVAGLKHFEQRTRAGIWFLPPAWSPNRRRCFCITTSPSAPLPSKRPPTSPSAYAWRPRSPQSPLRCKPAALAPHTSRLIFPHRTALELGPHSCLAPCCRINSIRSSRATTTGTQVAKAPLGGPAVEPGHPARLHSRCSRKKASVRSQASCAFSASYRPVESL